MIEEEGINFLQKENALLQDMATCKEPFDDNSMSMWHLSHEGWVIYENGLYIDIERYR